MPRTPRRWTPEEDQILRREAASQLEEGSVKSWNRIADQLPGRSNKDCRKRWCNEVAGGLKKGPWSRDEDRMLEEAVRKYGQRWTAIAPMVGTRSADQCAKRWTHSLDPGLDRSVWTKEEDLLLFRAVEKHKRSWKEIQNLHYPGRSCNDIKNRHTILSRRTDSISLSELRTPCCDSYGTERTLKDQRRPRSHASSEISLDTYSTAFLTDTEEPARSGSADMLDLHTMNDTEISFEGYLQSSGFTPKSVSLTLPPISQEDMPNLSHMGMEDVNIDQFVDFSDLYTSGASCTSQSSTGMTTPWPSDSATDVAIFDEALQKIASSPSDALTEMDLTGDPQLKALSRPATMSGLDDEDMESTKHSQVRLVIDSPIQETSRAIIDSVLRAQAKVSMTAEADSRMTLTLMDIPTPSVNALLSILFETGTKFHMETD